MGFKRRNRPGQAHDLPWPIVALWLWDNTSEHFYNQSRQFLAGEPLLRLLCSPLIRTGSKDKIVRGKHGRFNNCDWDVRSRPEENIANVSIFQKM